MKFVNQLAALTLCALAGLHSVGHAQDTDLFMTTPIEAGALPNVLIILDNTANWSASAAGTTKFELEKAALTSVVSNLPEGKFNIGLMLFSETGAGNSNPSGGYVRSAIREMTATNKTSLVDLINGLGVNADKGNGAEYALGMHEAYLYFQGMNARSGHNKVKRDNYAFNPNPTYRSPIIDSCAKNYIIFISNGAPDNGENTTAQNLLDARGGKLTSDPISLTPSGKQANWTDEYARFMATHNINTYTIDVNPLTNGQGPDNTALLRSAANQGDGQYYAVYDAADLQLALENAFDEIQAVNSVFAATALPVSVNVRGTYLNEVYMAVFRPDANADPRWFGNLKLFQLAINPSTNTLFLADANGDEAQSPVTGFLRTSAVSFWTEASTYWNFSPRGTPVSGSDSPDGDMVEKGGSAQQQRNDYANGRNLYTCTSCATNSLLSGTPVTNTHVTKENLGVTDNTQRDLLIDWIRGADNTTPAERNATEVRPSLHGDVIHSRPAVVNYNRSGNDDDIVVFYGANDGVFRAVKGGKAASDGGSELWGFVAPEFFGKLNRLRSNTPGINVPSDPADPDGNKPYFMDGNVSTYTLDANSDGQINAANGDKAYLYVTMRRGGRFIYAFDVTTPETPKLLWKRSNSDTGYSELGQTWSEAKIANIKLGGTSTPVLIMGAGYDPAAEDISPVGADTMGRGVFVINALNGNVIWQAGKNGIIDANMENSIASDITVIDRNGDGFDDRVYAVDTGANVWRLDIGDTTSTGNWKVNKLASLGGTGAHARKFLYPADVVYGGDGMGAYDAVLVGSGDRENPFDTSVTNHFYMLKDRHVGSTGAGQDTIILSDLYDASLNLIQDGTAAQQATAQESLLAAKGWYITLASGEKVVGGAVAISGTVFFSTNQPTPPDLNSCSSNLGIARIYAMSYKDATATINFDGTEGMDRFKEVAGGGFLPSPTPVVVEIDDNDDDNYGAGKTVVGISFGVEIMNPPGVDLEKRKRTFWHKLID